MFWYRNRYYAVEVSGVKEKVLSKEIDMFFDRFMLPESVTGPIAPKKAEPQRK